MTIFQIDDSRPFISSGGIPVQWHTGSGALWDISSRVTRLNSRGIFFKRRSWHTRGGLDSLGWTRERCHYSAYGLCSTDTSIILPSLQTPFVNENRDDECSSTSTLRAVTSANRYDLSSCDILDAGRDLVLADGYIFQRGDSSLPDWIYWTVCVLVVYLVRCLSKYIMASITKDQKDGGKYPSSTACIVSSIITTTLILAQGDGVFITEEDLIFHWFTAFYILSYLLLFIGTRISASPASKDPPFYNLLAGVMQFVACRMFCGSETPYNPPLVFIIGIRLFIKSRRGTDIIRSTTILLDSFMLGLMCTLGFTPEYQYLIALFAAAWMGSDVLA